MVRVEEAEMPTAMSPTLNGVMTTDALSIRALAKLLVKCVIVSLVRGLERCHDLRIKLSANKRH